MRLPAIPHTKKNAMVNSRSLDPLSWIAIAERKRHNKRLIDSPIPMPLGSVVKKALNSRPAFSESIPMPES